MKMTTSRFESAITVELTAAPDLRIRSEVPCDLCPEALGYAACRFLAHTPRLARYYAARSCELRFGSSRRDRKPQYFRVLARAALLELPGGWAALRLRVDPDGITVTGLELTRARPVRKLPEPAEPKIGVWRSGMDG